MKRWLSKLENSYKTINKFHFDMKIFYQLIKRFARPVNMVAIIVGGFLGYIFYYSTSCCSDEMAISLNPLITVVYGSMTGMLISTKS
jgi:hypothetical protein